MEIDRIKELYVVPIPIGQDRPKEIGPPEPLKTSSIGSTIMQKHVLHVR